MFVCLLRQKNSHSHCADSWIFPRFKGILLRQVVGYVPLVAENNIHFLLSGQQLHLEGSSNAQAFGSGLAQALGWL